MMDKLSLNIHFLSELEKMKSVMRRTPMLDGSGRFEDDAQHSWHISLYAMTLRSFAAPDVDWERAVQMTLTHDLVEIYAGDTYAYDATGYQDKTQRELDAADKLFALPDPDTGTYMRGLWEEFEECATPTAKYANAVDRLQPMIINYQSGGAVWRKNGITAAQVLERQRVTLEALPAAEDFVRELVADAQLRGWLR